MSSSGSVPHLGPPARLGDRALFEEIYRRELSAVRNFVRRLGAPNLHADDLVHDVILTAYQHFDSYDRARPARPWLLGIALRRYWTFSQRAAVRREIKRDVSWVEDEALLPDESFAHREERALLMRALETLDLDRRAAFVMHHLEGCTAPEIAQALDVPLNTVYSRLRRALEHVEQVIPTLCGKAKGP
jgi:RNA polymerase sigma-70 factor (ECF subfamily)